MSEYEQWSLTLTAIGHLIVASSIIYAARSWLVSEKSLEREIQKDTRSYLSDIVWHNLGRIKQMYKATLDADFGHIGPLMEGAF